MSHLQQLADNRHERRLSRMLPSTSREVSQSEDNEVTE